jgi:hypothetical protein
MKATQIIFFTLFALSAKAQFTIDWWTVGGGGGTSTSGVYAVSGTAGQYDAGGLMAGGNYSVTGGFWSVLGAVQSPGAPALTQLPVFRIVAGMGRRER